VTNYSFPITCGILWTIIGCKSFKGAEGEPPDAGSDSFGKGSGGGQSGDTGFPSADTDYESPHDKIGGGSLWLSLFTEDGALIEEMEVPGLPEEHLENIYTEMESDLTGIPAGAGMDELPGVDMTIAVYQTGIWTREDYEALGASDQCVKWSEYCESVSWTLHFYFSEERGEYLFNQADPTFGLVNYDAIPRFEEGVADGQVEGGPAETYMGSAWVWGPQMINSGNTVESEEDIALMQALTERRWPGLHRVEFNWAFDPAVSIRH
jgi:hypothetical protein